MMLLGKRARHPMKRTTSMTEFSYDDLSVALPPPSDHALDHDHQNHKVIGYVSPLPIHRRNSADFVLNHNNSSSTFLRTCSLCNRRLAPTRDIFMYRGDSAFCSLECRQQQMTQDEWREKCNPKESNSSKSHSTSVSSTKAESIAAL